MLVRELDCGGKNVELKYLAIISLGVKNIHLGTTLPGFISPEILNFLVSEFGVSTIKSVDEDIDYFING